jgi:phospholipase/carboxylesterase
MAVSTYHHIEKTGADGAPLVFAFHGTGGDENQFFSLLEQILPSAGIIAPRGDVSEFGASRFFKRTGEGVYDMPDLAARTEKMAAFVTAHKNANPDAPVFGLGYSNGANILASVMLAHSDLFDRAVLMHPLIPWAPAPATGLQNRKVLITAGRRDPICPPGQTQALIDYFKAQHCETTAVWHEGGHEVRPTEVSAADAFLNAA